jgi:formylglycine-generating enzyme required for sulfatase activity
MARWRSLDTFADFDALAEDERSALALEIAGALGPRFASHGELLGERRLAAVELRHDGAAPTIFAVIPGGEFAMGVRPEERDELIAVLGGDDEGRIEDLLRRAEPVHIVKVAPFLIATRVLPLESARALSAEVAALEIDRGRIGKLEAPVCLYANEIAGVLAGGPPGCRLPCEAEWEWVAREGGARSWVVAPEKWLAYDWSGSPNAFGVDLTSQDPEWVADAWHESYEGAPSTAVAWWAGAKPEVTRGVHSGWQDEIEAVVTACGYRQEGSDTAFQPMRLALDLPRVR